MIADDQALMPLQAWPKFAEFLFVTDENITEMPNMVLRLDNCIPVIDHSLITLILIRKLSTTKWKAGFGIQEV